MHNKRACSSFKKKDEPSSDSESEVVLEEEVLDAIEMSASDTDSDISFASDGHGGMHNAESDSDSDFTMSDDDDSDTEEGDVATGRNEFTKALAISKANAAKAASDDGPGTSSSGGGGGGGASELNASEEDDETVKAIIAAIKKPRSSPPEIKLEDFITDICFHPERNIIALGTIMGDVALYEYSNEGNNLLRTIEIHAKACRDVEFTDDGLSLLTCSKDKSIMITDMETEKLKKFYESAHDDPINKLLVLDEHLFATGDDAGMVKLWDTRTKHEVFALKEVEDYISQMLTNDDKKLLLCASGDGYLTTINIKAKKMYVQSEPYEEELTCMGTYRGDSKLVVGTSKGRLYTYNWGQFGYHCDMFPGVKSSMNVMIPITDRIGCVAGEEGIIRAVHVAPFRNLGIVGQHSMPIECLDVNSTGELIASSSHNNDVRFWNVKYFEDFGDIKYNEKHNAHKEKSHNLPSSKFSNAGDFFSDLAKAPSDDDE